MKPEAHFIKNRGCASKLSKKKSTSTATETYLIEIPSMNYRKAQIDWEAFDRLKFSHGDHGCTLNETQDFSRSRSSSESGSTDSLLEEVNDFLNVAKHKLVTMKDWEQIRAKKPKETKKAFKSKLDEELEY